jgi:uncharacterized protein YprB with RNaseH-like and TPR domain
MNKKPKVLIYDIETTALEIHAWGTFQVNAIAVKKEWELLSFSYKWLGKKKVYFRKREGKDDKSLCKELRKLFNEADMVVAHNGEKFDIKKANTRFLFHYLPPYREPASRDTLKFARTKFKFTSNRLGALGEYLGLGDKIQNMPFEVWLECLADKAKAWKKMELYNKRDVILLEDIYLIMRPWMKDHPNLSLLTGVRDCPNCGSTRLTKQGTKATHRTIQQQFKCSDCLSWFSQPIGKKLPKYGEK